MLDFGFVTDDDPAPQPLPDLRASDADRERAVLTLGRAAGDGRLDVEELEERLQLAYAARTHSELERLLADVGGAIAGDLAQAPVPAPRTRVGPAGVDGTSWIVSIMGGNQRTGRWRVAERCNVVNFMGGAELDLHDVELSDHVTVVNVYTLMGGFEIRVPDGVDVQISKFAFMGGHEVKLGSEPPPPGAPVIRIRLWTMMGGGEVRRGRKRDRRDRGDDRALEA